MSPRRPSGAVLAPALAALLLAGLPATVPAVAPASASTSSAAAPATMRTVVATLRDQTRLAPPPRPGRRARLRHVVESLQARATRDQAALRSLLRQRAREGLVGEVTPLWVVDAVSFTATEEVIDEVSRRPEVIGVADDAEHLVHLAAPAEPGVAAVGAPSAWEQGATGTGVVVATLDSGVDLDHPDLAGRWRGGTNSWFDPYGQHPSVPTDLSGHGTATTSVIVGGDASGSSIGVAPGATWIAARVFDDRGASTETAVHQAFQWLLDPDHDPTTADAPQVVEASWSLGTAPGCDLTYREDVRALRAAGILPVFAAGNLGPGAGTATSPGNYPEVLSVGATGTTGSVWSGSSRGPSGCGGRLRAYPDLVAPGVGIVAADRYGLYQTLTGTSVAAPHAAGALAVLLGTGDLTPDQQAAALTRSAVDLGPAGPDDTYGAGGLDVAAALAWVRSRTDTVGPVTSGVTAAPGLGRGTEPVTVQGSADDGPDGSGVVAAELFVDTVTADGTGTPVPVAGGATASLTAQVAPAVLAGLADGTHTVWLHALDASGTWGAPVAAAFTLDRVAPVVGTASATPSPTAGAATVQLSAPVTESGSGLDRVEWFADADPGVGNGSAATVTGSGPFTASAAIDVRAWAPGPHVVTVRARDAAGTWSDARTVTVEVSTAAPTHLTFSTDTSTKVPGVAGTADDADLYGWAGSAFAREWDASAVGLPAGADVDGLDRIDATHFYVSFAAATTTVPGLGAVDDEDVVRYDAGTWSRWFDGTARGLTAAGLDLDAISVQDGTLFFSTLGNVAVPGVPGTPDDADVYAWDGARFTRAWDASAAGLPGAANLDGYSRVSASDSYVSFSATSTTVPGLGTVQDEDVLHRVGATWSTFFDGTSRGLTADGLDVDAFDVW